MAVSLVPQSLLLSVAVCFLLQGLQSQALTSDLVDFETIVSAATSLYSYVNWQGFHSFYPLTNFTCSGKITKVAFITLNSDDQAPTARFATWHRTSGGWYNRRDYIDAQDAVLVRSTNLYRLYELTLTGSRRIDFQSNDTFGIRLPGGEQNPIHQVGGGWNQYVGTSRENYENNQTEFPMSTLFDGVSYPLVALETDTDPSCGKGFLKRESLTKVMEVNPSYGGEDTVGLLDTDSTSYPQRQFIIPGMKFNTTGVLKKWTFATSSSFNSQLSGWPKLQVWRNNGATYTLINRNQSTVEPRPTGYLNVYEVVLPESDQFTVRAGDAFGVYIPDRRRHSLAFVANSSRGYVISEVDVRTRILRAFRCSDVNGDACLRAYPLVSAEIDAEISTTEDITIPLSTTVPISTPSVATDQDTPETEGFTDSAAGAVTADGSNGSTKNELTSKPKTTTLTSKAETTTPSVQIDGNKGNLPLIGGVVGTLFVLIVGLTIALLLLMLYLRKRKSVSKHIQVTENEAYGSVQRRLAQANNIELKKNVVYGVNPTQSPDNIELKQNIIYGVNHRTQTRNDDLGETSAQRQRFLCQDQDISCRCDPGSIEERPHVQSTQVLEEPGEYDYVRV